MSTTLWAIKAAKKNKGNDVIPGTSRHIMAEMLSNVQTTKDGITAFKESLLACTEQLNDIIDALNNDSPSVLEKANMCLSFDIKDESSQFSKTSSDFHPELKLELSEKHVLSDSEQIHEDLIPKENTENPKSSSISFHMGSSGNENMQREEPKEPPVDAVVSEKNEAKTDDLISALSPIHIQRTAPVSSPNVNLSFIPIANSIDPQKFDNKVDLESDTSFQAISTAIRKSFAGKLSMNQFAGSLPLYSDRDESEARLNTYERNFGPVDISGDTTGALARTNDAKLVDTKIIDTATTEARSQDTKRVVSAHIPPNRERSIYTKRASVFVGLPDREPISFLNSRHSIKVKSEESEKASLNSEPTLKTATKMSVNIARNLNLRFPDKVTEKEIQKQAEDRERAPENETRNETQERLKPKLESKIVSKLTTFPNRITNSQATNIDHTATRPNLRASKIPRISPARSPTRTRSPRREERSRPAQLKRFSTRTTDSGSPNRENSPTERDKKGLTLKSELPSSSRSTRSPTKYGHILENKDSPTDYKGMVKVEPEDPQRLSLHANNTTAKTGKIKEPLLKNRFLTTTLHPDNPLRFTGRPKSPLKRASEKRAVPEKSLLKFEPRPKKKINISINHQEQRLQKVTSPTERLVTSPKKEPEVQRKSLKRARAPQDIHVVPRRRAVGNAIPLPDAARGIFTAERQRKSTKTATPSKNILSLPNVGTLQSPGVRGDALPDIPSDDDELRSKKYLKKWANTPEVIRTMRENKDFDPVAAIGELPVLKMEEIFVTMSAKQRGITSSKGSA